MDKMHFDEEQLYRLEAFNKKGPLLFIRITGPFCNANCYLLFELYR